MNWICKICNKSDFINDDIYIICQNCGCQQKYNESNDKLYVCNDNESYYWYNFKFKISICILK